MTYSLERSELDCQRFGMLVGKAVDVALPDVQSLFSESKEKGFDVIFARVPATEIALAQSLETIGFRLMDTLVYYRRNVGPDVGGVRSAGRARRFESADTHRIEEIAGRAFAGYCSHYHADLRFERVASDLVYRDWARRSCLDRSAADDVIVIESGETVAGFATLKKGDNGEVEIPLVAVDPDYQRRGLYDELLAGAIRWTSAIHATTIFSSTQITNVAAQAGWIRAGFLPRNFFYTMHWWVKAGLEPGLPPAALSADVPKSINDDTSRRI